MSRTRKPAPPRRRTRTAAEPARGPAERCAELEAAVARARELLALAVRAGDRNLARRRRHTLKLLLQRREQQFGEPRNSPWPDVGPGVIDGHGRGDW